MPSGVSQIFPRDICQHVLCLGVKAGCPEGGEWATSVGSDRWGSCLQRGSKYAGQMREGRVVELAARECKNMEEAGNGLAGG